MALFRKLVFRKPPDGLLEICERVYGGAVIQYFGYMDKILYLFQIELPKYCSQLQKKNKTIRAYKQLNDDMEREEMMFRVVFITAFIRSNILILNRDEVDALWDAKDRFPKDFKAEILFSETDVAESVVSVDFSGMEEKDGLPVQAFAKVHEFFSSVDWSDPNADAALNMLQQISTSNILQEMSDTDFLVISPGRQVSSPTKGQESKMHAVRETSKLSVTKPESSESPKARIVVIKEAEVRDCQISFEPSDQSPTISPQTPQLPLGHDMTFHQVNMFRYPIH